MKKCFRCGAQYTEDQKYCTVCGAKTENASNTVYCDYCSSENETDARFCRICGNLIGTKQSEYKKINALAVWVGFFALFAVLMCISLFV